MLVLSRKQSERIRVGQDIVVTVVRVAGDKVRLGIEAPPDVVVLRDELRPLAPLAAANLSAGAAGSISARSAANSN
jgi:carbon storage regulator